MGPGPARMVPMDSGAALLASPVRRRIVDTLTGHDLEEGRGMSAAELAGLLDLHVTTVRFHLDQLVAAGLLTTHVRHRAGAGRPAKLYAVDPAAFGEPQSTTAYHVLTELLAATLEQSADGTVITPEQAGMRWMQAHLDAAPDDMVPADSPGRWLSKVGRMLDVLGRWGYVPDVTTSDGGRTAEVTLRDCPFIELARTNPAVVCGVHRGLLRGAMDRLGETDTNISLRAFVDATTCRARLTTRAPFAPAQGPRRIPVPPKEQPHE